MLAKLKFIVEGVLEMSDGHLVSVYFMYGSKEVVEAS